RLGGCGALDPIDRKAIWAVTGSTKSRASAQGKVGDVGGIRHSEGVPCRQKGGHDTSSPADVRIHPDGWEDRESALTRVPARVGATRVPEWAQAGTRRTSRLRRRPAIASGTSTTMATTLTPAKP